MADYQYRSIFEAYQDGQDRVASRRSQQNSDMMSLINAYQNQAQLGLQQQRLYFDTVVKPRLDREAREEEIAARFDLAELQFEHRMSELGETERLRLDALEEQREYDANREDLALSNEAALDQLRSIQQQIEEIEGQIGDQNRNPLADAQARSNLRNQRAALYIQHNQLAERFDFIEPLEIPSLASEGYTIQPGASSAASSPSELSMGETVADPTQGAQLHESSFDPNIGGSVFNSSSASLTPVSMNIDPQGSISAPGFPSGTPAYGEYVYKSMRTEVLTNPAMIPGGEQTMARLGMNPQSIDFLAAARTMDGYGAAFAVSPSLGKQRGEVASAVSYAVEHARIPQSIRQSPADMARVAYLMSVISKIENQGRVTSGAREGVTLAAGAHAGDRAQGGFQIMPNTAISPQMGIPNVFEVAASLGLLKTKSRSKATATLLLRDPRINSVFAMNMLSRAYELADGDMTAVAASYVGGAGRIREYQRTGTMNNAHGREYIQKFRDILASDRIHSATRGF